MNMIFMDSTAYEYDRPCIYFMYIHHVWQHQIKIKLHGQIDVNVRHQFEAPS